MPLGSTSISELPNISKRLKACCRRAKLFDADELFLTNTETLRQNLRIDPYDFDVLRLHAAHAIAPPPQSVLDILQGTPPAKRFLGKNGSNLPLSPPREKRRKIDQPIPFVDFVPPTPGQDVWSSSWPSWKKISNESDEPDSNSDSDDDPDFSNSSLDRLVASSPHTSLTEPLHPSNREENDQGAPLCLARDVITSGRPGHVLTTGDIQLDRLLNSGFRVGAITEVVGESASGKTQLAIQTAVYAILDFLPFDPNQTEPQGSVANLDSFCLRDLLGGVGMVPLDETCSFGKAVAYITSEGESAGQSITKRAVQIAESAIRQRFQVALKRTNQIVTNNDDDDIMPLSSSPECEGLVVQRGLRQLLDHLYVACVSDVEALDHALKYTLPGLISRIQQAQSSSSSSSSSSTTVLSGTNHRSASSSSNPTPPSQIRLVIIDSLPPLLQDETIPTQTIDHLVQRSRILSELADSLKSISISIPPSPSPTTSSSSLSGSAILVINHVSDSFGDEKQIAHQFVFSSSSSYDPLPLPPQPISSSSSISLSYSVQSAFVTGLLASLPSSSTNTSCFFHPKSAQLGHQWSNSINTRLMFSKSQSNNNMASRQANLVFSPFSKSLQDRNYQSIPFYISSCGIVSTQKQLQQQQDDDDDDDGVDFLLHHPDLDDDQLFALQFDSSS